MNIVLIGPPGSGKGTQAEMLARKFKLYHLQTGALSRELIKKDKRLKRIYESGKLIPEEEMTMYVMDFLKNKRPDLKNILFEGFPRFISQYDALENFLKFKGDDIDAFITLEISKKEAIKRISSRRICGKCGEVYNILTNPPKKKGVCDKCGGKLIQRSDDKPKAIGTRFQYYKDNTKKMIDYVEKRGKLIKIDGERPINVIFDDIVEQLKDVKDKD